MMINAGTTNRTRKVENINPKQIVMAIGTIYIARVDDSNINGLSPAIVVRDVSNTALNLERDASLMASIVDSPSANPLLKKLIRTIESFTTIPVSEKKASNDIAPISKFMTQWPKIAPVSPSGIAVMTARGHV